MEEFDTSKISKNYNSIGTMFDDMEAEWKKDHPVHYWFDEITRDWWWPFPCAHHVIYSAPQLIISRIISDSYYEVKFAWQRVFRGWDDRVIWGIDYWLANIMLEVLPEYKKSGHGIPQLCFPKDYMLNSPYNDEDKKIEKDAIKLWNQELDIMIDGFKARKQMDELHGWKTIEEHRQLDKRLQKGLQKFSEYYLDLWD